MSKKIYWILILAGALSIVFISALANRISGNVSVDILLNNFYSFIRNNLWQSLAVTSLLLGVWFSLVRRRIFISLFLLVFSFFSSFVFPGIF